MADAAGHSLMAVFGSEALGAAPSRTTCAFWVERAFIHDTIHFPEKRFQIELEVSKVADQGEVLH
jgi:hypothetical protein